MYCADLCMMREVSHGHLEMQKLALCMNHTVKKKTVCPSAFIQNSHWLQWSFSLTADTLEKCKWTNPVASIETVCPWDSEREMSLRCLMICFSCIALQLQTFQSNNRVFLISPDFLGEQLQKQMNWANSKKMIRLLQPLPGQAFLKPKWPASRK